MKSFAKNDDRTKGAISLLKNLKECFMKVFVLKILKVMILIPLNTQISFKSNLAVTIQLIEQTIQSIEFVRLFDQVKVFSCNSNNCIYCHIQSIVLEIQSIEKPFSSKNILGYFY